MGKYVKEDLEKLIFEGNLSYDKIGEMYQVSGSAIRKNAKKLGIELPQRRKINPNETFGKGIKRVEIFCLNCGKPLERFQKVYCDNTCKSEFEYKQWGIEWKAGNKTGTIGEYGISNQLKRYLYEKYDKKCTICGWGETNPTSGTIPVEIEHIDGNFENNEEENLTLLCPNCHSLTPTYKGANKGNGRKERKKYT